LTPSADPFAFYGAAANLATGELYVTLGDFGTGANTWYATIPGPGAAAVLSLIAIVSRRRRR